MVMQYINPTEMRALDMNSAYFGVGFAALMENAGSAVADEGGKIAGPEARIAVICGTGNNGGDGFVAAKYLSKAGWALDVYLVGGKNGVRTDEARAALKELEGIGVNIVEVSKPGEIKSDYDLLVDALLGTGIKGEPREPVKGMIDQINKTEANKVSIDVPSGLGSKTVVKADLVVSLHKAKEGLENFTTVVRDIGIPDKAGTYVGPGDLITNLRRRRASHKGDNGRVMVVAGSEQYHGAPVLSGLGALRAGSDLVTIIVPESILGVVRTAMPDFIARGYKGDYLNPAAADDIIDLAKGQDVMVIGPGLGISGEIEETLNLILSRIKIPVVIDADALKQMDKKLLTPSTVVTPHAAEFTLLTGKSLPKATVQTKEVVARWSKRLSTTILLKSPEDIIASPEGKVKLNDTGNAGMTVGGTGDVLAGVVAGFITQGMDSFAAACAAAFVNGAAGDTLQQFKGYGYTASDVANEIPYTMKRFFDMYG